MSDAKTPERTLVVQDLEEYPTAGVMSSCRRYADQKAIWTCWMLQPLPECNGMNHKTVSHGKKVHCHGVYCVDGVRPPAAMSARNEPSRLFTFRSTAGKFRMWTSHAQRQKAKGLKSSLSQMTVKDFRFKAYQRNLKDLYLQMEDRAVCLHDAGLPSFRYEASSRSVP